MYYQLLVLLLLLVILLWVFVSSVSNVIKSEARFHNISSHQNGSSIICNDVIMDISLQIEVVVSGMYLNSTKTQYNYMTLSGIPSQYYTG